MWQVQGISCIIEAQIVPVRSFLSCCNRSHDRNRGVWGFSEERKRGALMFRAVHSCSSHLVGGCNEELLPTAVSVESQFFAGFAI